MANGAMAPQASAFDVLISGHRRGLLASVASAGDRRCRKQKPWMRRGRLLFGLAARKPRERSEVLRKAWELMNGRLRGFSPGYHALKMARPHADALGEAHL